MNQLARNTAKTLKRKLVVLSLAVASLALAGVASGPVLEAAGFKEPPGQQKRNFTISGNLATQLSPGTSGPLNLTFNNPNQQTLQIEELLVAVVGTSSAACHPNNFSATQYSGAYPIAIPRGASSLGSAVPNSSKWPRVGMVDKPTVNQDGCKGVLVSLAYNAVASK
jgi:hypothetical protein